jgi:hypothetical protein
MVNERMRNCSAQGSFDFQYVCGKIDSEPAKHYYDEQFEN